MTTFVVVHPEPPRFDWSASVFGSRCALIASEMLALQSPHSKGNAVVDKQRVVLPSEVADAVTGIQCARLRYGEGKARRQITKPVLAAQPIHHEADLGVKRLFVT